MNQPLKNIGIIIQARLGSTRLPSKILLPIKGNSIFQIQIDRLKHIDCPIYIATTTKDADNAVVDFATRNNLSYYRGDEDNVLSRYYECAKEYKLDVIIRLTSDCPLIDPVIIKDGLDQYIALNNSRLYISNTVTRSYPRGFDFEIFSFELLKDAFVKAVESSDKEHVTPFMWKNRSGDIDIKQIIRTIDASNYRLTLDTQEDLTLLKILIEQYHADSLSGNEIISIMQAHPELALINQHIEQKKVG